MSRTIILDSGVLGLVTKPDKKTTTDRSITQWTIDVLRAGNRLLVPAIADYEIRRELVRIGSSRGIASLDAWNTAVPDRFVDLTNSDLRLACNLWARARNEGNPTADPKEIDADVLIAAQAHNLRLPRLSYIVATTNGGHLALFVPADLWIKISP